MKMDYYQDYQNIFDGSGSQVDEANHSSDTPNNAGGNESQDGVYNLIDLEGRDQGDDNVHSQQPLNLTYASKSFAEDLVGLQPVNSDCQKPSTSGSQDERGSLLPSHTRGTKRRGKRASKRVEARSATPESIASEIDPYTQWYQWYQNYYKHFYPVYDFCGRQELQQQEVKRHIPRSAVPLVPPPTQPQQPQFAQMGANNFPGWPMLAQLASRAGGATTGMPGGGSQQQMNDLAAYFYQYYFGGMAAVNGWPMPTGRTTPKVFVEPHMRASLSTPGLLIQVLPNRPSDGEPGRVEIVDISQVASDVVAEVTSRLAHASVADRHGRRHGSQKSSVGIIFPSAYTGPNEGRTSSVCADQEGGDSHTEASTEVETDQEEDEYVGLVNAWDRTDHVLYPGPLVAGSALKHDVLAFLRGKVEEIQDRMPLDWDSASLLLSYLELLVKNNGEVHSGDVVNLLLGNEGSVSSAAVSRSYDYSSGPMMSVTPASLYPTTTGTRDLVKRQGSFAIGGGSGLYLDELGSPTHSGRESPRVLTHAASISGSFLPLASQQLQRKGSASSSTGAASISRLLRRGGLLAELGSAQEREMAVLQRFRELLMHGHPVKALEHACQQQLWGHAFALALRLGASGGRGAAAAASSHLERVMERFLARAIHPADPLLTLYQITANELPRSVDQLAYAVGADSGDWRAHLAMLLSAPEGHTGLVRESLERMGESLLARRLLFAAHLCFLLAADADAHSGAAPTPPRMPERIWLIGLASPATSATTAAGGRFVMSAEVERASTEAVQLTEVYEYTLALATRDRHFFLPNFLPFKFAYCLRLIDAGLIEKAYRYLAVLATSLTALLEEQEEAETEEGGQLAPTDLRALFLMASQCLHLAQRLRLHPEVGGFEESSSSHSPPWMQRLAEIYQRVSAELGLANAERPYLDPPRGASSSPANQESEFQQQQQQQQQQPISQPGQQQQHMQTNAFHHHHYQHSQQSSSTPKSSLQAQQQQQRNPRQPQSQQQQQQAAGVVSSTSGQSFLNNVASQQHQPPAPKQQQQQPQSIIHDIPSPSPQQPEKPPTDARSQQPPPQQQFLRPSQDLQPHAPPPQQQQPSMMQMMPESPQQKQVQSPQGGGGFFVPVLDPSQMDASATGDAASSGFGYDYFAGIVSSQPQPRSRTTSGASSHGSPESPSSADRGAPSPPTSSSPATRGLQAHRSMPNNSGSIVRDSRNRSGVQAANLEADDSRASRNSAFTAAPAQKPKPADRNQEDQQQPQQQGNTEENKATGGKPGWFSGLLGRIKGGGQEIHLPDDSNPSIVYDEAAGCWRDLRGGDDASEEVPPPPPPPPGFVSSPSASSQPPKSATTASPAPSAASPLPLFPPLGAGAHVRTSGGGGGARSRYVNVLANNGVSSSTVGGKKPNLMPPMPTPPNFAS